LEVRDEFLRLDVEHQTQTLNTFIISLGDTKIAVDLYEKEKGGQSSSSSLSLSTQHELDVEKERLRANVKHMRSSWKRILFMLKNAIQSPFIKCNLPLFPLTVECRARVQQVEEILMGDTSASDFPCSHLTSIEELEKILFTLIENVALGSSVQAFLIPDFTKPDDVVF